MTVAVSDSAHDDGNVPFGSLVFGPFVVPPELLPLNFAFAGPPGAGKSVLIHLLLLQLLWRIGHPKFPDHRALIFDAKGDALDTIASCGATCPVYNLNPFEKDSVGIDLGADVTDEPTASEFATIMLPDDHAAGKESHFFIEACRCEMQALMTVLMRRAPQRWTFRDVCLGLLNADRLGKILALYSDTASVHADFSKAKEYPGIRATIQTKLRSLRYIAAAWHSSGKYVSLKNWIRDSSILVLGSNLAHETALRAINRFVIKRLSELLLDQPDSSARRTIFVLDELRKFGFPDGLNDLMTKGRSRGAVSILGFQSYSGLCSKEALGRELTDELLAQVAFMAFLRMGTDRATAEWASRIIGEHYRYVYTRGDSTTNGDRGSGDDSANRRQTTTSFNMSIEKRFIVSPEELMALPLPSLETALEGFFLAPGQPVAGYGIPGKSLFKEILPPKQENKSSFSRERPMSDCELQEWEAHDFVRLNLPEIMSSIQLSPEAGLSGIRRISKFSQKRSDSSAFDRAD